MGQNRLISLFNMQFKRVMKKLPALMAVNLLVCAIGGALAFYFLREGILQKNGQKYRIGIVGELEESYIGFQFLALIKAMDDSRFVIDFQMLSEREAAKALREGKLTAYVRIPDGLVANLERGINSQAIEYVVPDGQEGLVSTLMKELTGEVSVIVTRSQNATYGMQDILRKQGRKDIWGEATEQMCLRLISVIFGRTGLCQVEILGMANGLSAHGYYFCGIFVFFLLLLGINSGPLFYGRKRGLYELMEARGIGAARQVAGEYLAYLILVLLCMTGIYLGLNLVLGKGILQIPECQDMGTLSLAAFVAELLPAAAMLAAMQYFLYEAVTGIVSGVLLQFICGIGMCYLSGCFYPAAFFPTALQYLGRLLPTGVVMRYANAALSGSAVLPALLQNILYLLLFMGMSVLVRKYRIRRG